MCIAIKGIIKKCNGDAISAIPGSKSRRTFTRSSARAFLSRTERRPKGSDDLWLWSPHKYQNPGAPSRCLCRTAASPPLEWCCVQHRTVHPAQTHWAALPPVQRGHPEYRGRSDPLSAPPKAYFSDVKNSQA